MTSRWLHRFACLTVASTFLLLIAGANVTSHRAGLAVPDWPTTYGQFMYAFPVSKWVGNILHEHGHRLIASTVGLMTIVIAIWLVRIEPRRWLRRLGIIALATVIAQGLLGGLTVKFLLPPPISIAHAALAQAFFCITIAIAMGTAASQHSVGAPLRAGRPEDDRARKGAPTATTARGLSLATTIAIYLQLILGAAIRHSERGMIPHIIGAVGVTGCVGCLVVFVVRHLRQREFLAPAITLLALVAAQLGVGLATLAVRVPKDAVGQLSTLQIWLPTIHLAIGALILGTSFALTLKTFWLLRAVGARHAVPLHAYIELIKPRIVSMVLVTTSLGFVLGGTGPVSWPVLLISLFGIGCVSSGAAVLNNYLERDVDSKMTRTCRRVLPAGLIAPSRALAYGVSLVLIGLAALVIGVNLVTAFLALLAAFLYVLVYTPMKRLSWLNTTVGAVPGAIPPMCGWAAASGRLDVGAWVLFAILFTWQHPHFFSIAWMFRDDYRNAGLKMLPVVDPSGASTVRQTLIFSTLLIGVSLLPSFVGMTGRVYGIGALVLGCALLAVGALFCRARTFVDARRLLKASIIYLPLLVGLMMFDKL